MHLKQIQQVLRWIKHLKQRQVRQAKRYDQYNKKNIKFHIRRTSRIFIIELNEVQALDNTTNVMLSRFNELFHTCSPIEHSWN